ncbi:MAG: hypothetical protein ACRDBT_11340 [Aeromonas sp.]
MPDKDSKKPRADTLLLRDINPSYQKSAWGLLGKIMMGASEQINHNEKSELQRKIGHNI